jgi:hypothetical protein
MERERTIFSARVGRGVAGNANVLAFVTIDPKHTVAAARRAVASGRPVRYSIEVPADLATETGAFEHL